MATDYDAPRTKNAEDTAGRVARRTDRGAVGRRSIRPSSTRMRRSMRLICPTRTSPRSYPFA